MKSSLNFSRLTNGILSEASKQQVTGERIVTIPRESIVPNPKNEEVYEVNDLDALAVDIAERGIQQPIIVKQLIDGRYEIISGHRRYAANAIAVEQHDYEKGNYVPCIVRNTMTDDILETEAVILDNLQRYKTDYEKMQEIVTIQACAEERKRRGEDVPSTREYTMRKLGVSQSEITRYLKISASLIPELLPYFRLERFSTNVAHAIAKCDKEIQEYIYETWDVTENDGILTFPVMQSIVNKYYNKQIEQAKEIANPSAEAVQESGEQEQKENEGKSSAVENKGTSATLSLTESLSVIEDTWSEITDCIKQNESELSYTAKTKLAKKVSKQLALVAELQRDLVSLGLMGKSGDNDAR